MISVKYPDPGLCRTIHFFSTYWECRVNAAASGGECPYQLEFKQHCYCIHADRQKFERIEEMGLRP